MRTHVDLFSGIAGFALAASWAGVETIAFAEIEPYASRVIERHWPGVRNYGRVQDVPAIERVWLVTGGVPCQPASVAGKRLGTADDRWLWPEALAAVERIRPAWVLFENPTGILSLNDGVEFERICTSLEGQGYEVQPIVIPACGVGALHRRNRVWIMAHAKSIQPQRENEYARTNNAGHSRARSLSGQPTLLAHTTSGTRQRQTSGSARHAAFSGENVADTDRSNGHRRSGTLQVGRSGSASSIEEDSHARGTKWSIEPNVGRVAHGIPSRVDRLRGLGNAIVAQVAYQLIKRMIEAEEIKSDA